MTDIVEKIGKPIVGKAAAKPVSPSVVKTVTPANASKTKEAKLEKPELTDDDVAQLVPQENYLDSPLFYEVANYFGVEERQYSQAKNYLGEIVDWAIMRAKSNKIENILTQLNKIEQLMMPPGWGEERYKHVYRYVRLAAKADSMNKLVGAYEKKGKVGNG